MKTLRSFCSFLLRPIFGDITWRPPAWMRWLLAHPILTIIVLLLAVGAYVGNRYYQDYLAHLPKPAQVDWSITTRNISANEALTIQFSKLVGRLDSIGKPLPTGITINPQIKGEWKFYNGGYLVFVPSSENHWSAKTDYTVTLDAAVISPKILLTHYTTTFTTAPFTAKIYDPLFYINPKATDQRSVTATLRFSVPVNRDSLQNNLQVTVDNLQADASAGTTPLKFKLTYPRFDDPLLNDRTVYLRTQPIGVAEKSGYVHIQIPNNVATIYGNTEVEPTSPTDILVPSEENLFRIESANIVVVNKDNGDPEQDLVVNTSVGVQSEKLASAVHVYLLPKFKKTGKTDETEPYEWQSASEVDEKVRARLEPVPITAIPDQEEFSTLHSFHVNVPEGRYTLVEVDKGTEGIGSFKLATQFGAVGAVPTFPRQVTISHQGCLLALNGERKLTITSRGVDEIEYRLARVTPGQINHLVSQTEGSFSDPTFVSSNFDETNLAEEITRRTPISLKNNSETNYSSLDFSEFVTPNDQNKGKLGLFLLHAIGRKAGPDGGGFYKNDGTIFTDEEVNQKNKDNQEIVYPTMDGTLVSDERLILITDMGIVVKDNSDQTHDLFIQSIQNGDPVAGAHVEVLGKNGISVVSVDADATGHAVIPSLADFVREQRPVAYVVTKGADVSFLPFGRDDRQLNFSRFDTGGLPFVNPDDLRAFLFTDRGIYRPGDSAHIAVIAKQHNWKGKLDGISLELDYTDPKEQTVSTTNIKLNANGFAETTFDTKETSPTGIYTVGCYLVKDAKEGQDQEKVSLGSETFQVKEFLPDRLKLTVTQLKAPDKGWLNLSQIKTHLQLDNLYGAPADGNKITGKLSISSSEFGFESLPGFTFDDPYAADAYKSGDKLDIDLPEQFTDANGQAAVDLNQSNIRSCATQVSVLFEAFEKEGGRSVRGYTEALVSSRPWLMGVKLDGDFSYIKRDSKHAAHLIIVDPDLKPLAISKLSLRKIEHRFISVLVEGANGNYSYQSVEKLIPSGQETLDVSTSGVDWAVPTATPGNFEADVFDDKGDKVAVINYSVMGEANLSQVMDKNAELNAKLSKSEYRAGEDVEVSITAPYTGAGLLTIERDHVYAYKWFQAKTTSTIQKITIPADMEGNGYLNVTFVRGLDSKEIYLSPLSYSVLPFTINKEGRHTEVAIDAPKLGTPGQPLTWTVTASRPTEAVVYAVDEGILQVAGYKLPDPLSFFFEKEALAVDTRQTVDQILPEYSISRMVAAAGGDGGEDLLSHHLNPFKRKHDAPVVYWSGIVDLTPQGKSFTYNVPDYFAGTIRIMVVTNSFGALGASQVKLPVRGPFVILPNTPSVVAPGDDFDVSCTVANNVPGSGANAPIELSAETTDGLEVKQSPGPTTISEGKDGTVHWLVHTKNMLGNADFTVVAKFGSVSTRLASHISVRPATAYLTTLTSGYFSAGMFTSGFQNVPVERKLYPQFRENFAQASALPMGLSRGLSTYLEHYEYGCTEQLVSKAFPSLVSNDTLELGQTHDEVQKSLEGIVEVAETRQNDEGGIGLWSAKIVDSPMYTCYLVHLLTEAKDREYQVPDDFMAKCLDYLEKKVSPDPTSYYDARVQCYAIYLLTRNGRVTTNYIEHTRAWLERNGTKSDDVDFWKNDISCAYLASSYEILKNDTEAQKLIAQFHLIGPQAEYDYDFYNALGRDGLYLDLMAHHFPERLKQITPDDLLAIVKPIMAGDYNTISAAQAILGLDSYARAVNMKSAVADLAIGQMIKGLEQPLALQGANYPRANFSSDAESIVFHKPGKTAVGLPGLFYQLSQSGFDDTVVTQPIAEGIEVSRDYEDDKGKVIKTIHLGDELHVVIMVRAVGYDQITNVVVEDLLPGGFEVESEYIHSGDWDNNDIHYADVREDRVNLFGDIGAGETTVEYRLKATNKGTFIVPPIQAESMYNRKIRARTVNSTITVD